MTLAPDTPVVEHRGRVLDWRPRFDPRSLQYRVAPTATAVPTTGRLWAAHVLLDQGREGACVGFGNSGAAAADPVPAPGITDRSALAWYHRAQQLDEWPGEAYEGTSVLAGCLVGRERGYWRGFRWAKSAEELAAGIVKAKSDGGGPGIIGVEWRSGSYETDALGVLRASGDVVGGHCLCVLGFVPVKPSPALCGQLEALGLLAGVRALGGPCFVILNSWGPSFGKQGLALVPLDVMRAWVRAGGEFAIPEGRGLPKQPTQPATVAGGHGEDQADRTLHLRAVDVLHGDRIVDGLPPELGQETATVQQRRLVTGAGRDQVRVRCTAGVFTASVSAPITVRRSVA